jgi:NitT/TauT family transport system substrate-binding protein
MRRIANITTALCVTVMATTALVSGSVQRAVAQELTEITFLTNYTFHGRHSPYFVGVKKGFYEEAGFEVDIQPATGSGFVVAALEGGQADYGMADASTVVQSIAKGANTKAFAVFMDVTTSGLASREPYPTPQSLEGAKIAAGLTDSARVILPIILGEHGIDPQSVNWEAADPGVYVSLLLSGQVDLFTASIDGDFPSLMKIAKRENQEVHFSSFADWGYDVFGYFLVTDAARIESNPDEVRAFAAATAKAVQYAIENPQETADIMVEANPTLDVETVLAQWTQSIVAINTDYVAEHGYGSATADRVERTIGLVQEALGQTDMDLAADDVFAQGFVGN